MWVSYNLLSLILLSTLYNNVEVAEIRCFESNTSSYTTYNLENPELLLNSTYYKSNTKTRFITHGFGESADDPCVTGPADALLRKGDNVCAFDWRNEASNQLGPVEYPVAVTNAMALAEKFHQVLIQLFKAGLNPNDTYLIGHSLGAHLFGDAGKGLPEKVYYAYGLDPAGPEYEGALSFRGLDTTSAQKVVALHTNPGRLGTYENRATVDVYANCGNSTQPCCIGGLSYDITSEQNKCSHNRSCMYLTEALNNPGTFVARCTAGCSDWKAGGGSLTINLEDDISYGVSGLCYFQTNCNSPYGKGYAGSNYQN